MEESKRVPANYDDNDIKLGIVHDNPISDFFNKVGVVSPKVLDKDEERKLIVEAQQGDLKARNKLVNYNLKLVIKVAKYYQHVSNIAFEDLIQEGTLGLIHSIEKFQVNRGNRLSTYATYWIKQNIIRYIQQQGRTVRIPTRYNELISKYHKAEEVMSFDLGRQPRPEEFAAYLDLSVDKIYDLLQKTQGSSSLDVVTNNEGEDSNLALEEVIKDPSVDIMEQVNENDQLSSIMASLDVLTPSERYVFLKLHTRTSNNWVYKKQLAQDLGLSNSAKVTQLDKHAVKKIQKQLHLIKKKKRKKRTKSK